MKRKFWVFLTVVQVFVFQHAVAQLTAGQLKKSDAAENSPGMVDTNSTLPLDSMLIRWGSVSDINKWIQNNFCYDFERAKQLAENSSSRETTIIYTPEELYKVRSGVCIDLTRFAVEAANRIDTSRKVQFLMIEFEPITIDNMTIRKHWMAVYHEKEGYYFFADSKRPGYLAGPYESTDSFIREYEAYRDRKIISHKILPDYRKKKKMQSNQTLAN